MHELGIVFNIVASVEAFATQNQLSTVKSITLQVGEICTVVPKYLEDCYPAAVDKSALLHDTKLIIEIVPANSVCHQCYEVFSMLKHKQTCPDCGSTDTEIVSGKELEIKEIEAY